MRLDLKKVRIDINKNYGVLQGFCYEFTENNIYNIQGNNSLLVDKFIDILSGINNDYEGKIYFNDTKLNRKNIDKYRNKYVFKINFENSLIKELTLKEHFKLCFNLIKVNYNENKVNEVFRELGFNFDYEIIKMINVHY